MKTINYYCSHCGHKFQAEDKDILECPSCYWSSTVKREGEADAKEKLFGSSSTPKPRPKGSVFFFFSALLKLIAVLVVVIAFGFMLALGWKWYQSRDLSQPKAQKVSIPVGDIKAMKTLPTFETIPQSAQNILNRRLQFSEDRQLSSEEKKVLEARASFKTGSVERLPSQLWTVESFEKLIADQENIYRIPLAKGYKKKLVGVFEQKYIPSVQAFEAGDLIGARNLWVESLIFPIYRDDIAKHRGVALTMLRPFINDTLSKIGAVNNILIEKGIREKEEALNRQYQELLSLLGDQQWERAFQSILEIERRIDELEKPATIVSSPPPYPQSVGTVDRDIQVTLFDLQSTLSPAVADLTSLKGDVLKKKGIVEGFQKATLMKQQEIYDQAIDRISGRDWNAAINLLEKIDSPLALAQDAKEKIKIIRESKLI